MWFYCRHTTLFCTVNYVIINAAEFNSVNWQPYWIGHADMISVTMVISLACVSPLLKSIHYILFHWYPQKCFLFVRSTKSNILRVKFLYLWCFENKIKTIWHCCQDLTRLSGQKSRRSLTLTHMLSTHN